MPDYVRLQALKHFVLEESWVLDIAVRPGVVTLDVDLAYAADHPDLRPPRDGEYAYFRRGTLGFSGVTSVTWKTIDLHPSTDATGAIDWGHIDALEWAGAAFKLEGDFGEIELEASELGVTLTGPA